MTDALRQIADHLRVMLASATELHDGPGNVTGYQIKTGALHRILGVMAGANCPVSVPSIPNKSVALGGQATVAHVVVTDAGWAQLWVHGVHIQSGYGQAAKDQCDALAARINANHDGSAVPHGVLAVRERLPEGGNSKQERP